MVKQITRGKDIARNTYWSAVGMTAATMLAVQPVFADTMKFFGFRMNKCWSLSAVRIYCC